MEPQGVIVQCQRQRSEQTVASPGGWAITEKSTGGVGTFSLAREG